MSNLLFDGGMCSLNLILLEQSAFTGTQTAGAKVQMLHSTGP